MKHCLRKFPLLALLALACDAADDVRVQPLPSLERSSVEARLGLPEVTGPWRFAGWELAEGDSLGLDAELPGFGILLLQTQKRDSLAGVYMTSGGGRAPLTGEVRIDSVVSLVTMSGDGSGRYLVGEVARDTLWVESTTLAEPGSWRGDARVAFVRSRTPLAPFRRIRGAIPAPPPVDSASLVALQDSLSAARAAGAGATIPGARGAVGVPPGAATAGQAGPPSARPTAPISRPAAEAPPVTRPQEPPVGAPVTPPVVDTQPSEEEAEEAQPEEAPEPAPAVQREPPRVLGVPIVRDTSGGNLP